MPPHTGGYFEYYTMFNALSKPMHRFDNIEELSILYSSLLLYYTGVITCGDSAQGSSVCMDKDNLMSKELSWKYGHGLQ